MDYLKIYNSNYNKAYRTGEVTIKHKLIQFNKETLSFERASNLTQESFGNFEKRLLIDKEPKLVELKSIYQKSLSNYSKNAVELVLKNEVKKGFLKLSLNIQSNNYTLESFIKELAILNAANELLRLYNNHSALFKIMYENDYFDSFEIKDYHPIDFRDSKNYTDLLNKFYPLRKTPEIFSESFSVIQSYDPFDDLENNTPNFNEKEKAYLLHLIYKIIEDSKANIKLNNTEFYKVLSIVNLKDDSCLVSDNYKNSDYYRILSGGIEKISLDIKTQDSFIDILISKTRELKLKNITKYLSEKSTFLKASIARNSNKAK
jgi:hypothetical protein